MKLTLDEKQLRLAMAAGGIRSVSALARDSGVSVSYLRQVVAGLVPAVETRRRIAACLGVPPEALWVVIVAAEECA